MNNLQDIPGGKLVSQVYLPAVASGASDTVIPVFYAATACKIIEAYYVPISTLTGAATNYPVITLLNTGTAGTGTTVLGTAVTFNSTAVVATACVGKALVASTDAETVVKGAVVALKVAQEGNGIDLPAGIVEIVWWPTSV